MKLTSDAQVRLQRLLKAAGQDARGFRLWEILGTCSGSTPLFKPAHGPGKREIELEVGGICFYLPLRYVPVLENATLDYDRSLFGKGLKFTWPHCAECPGCSSTMTGVCRSNA